MVLGVVAVAAFFAEARQNVVCLAVRFRLVVRVQLFARPLQIRPCQFRLLFGEK